MSAPNPGISPNTPFKVTSKFNQQVAIDWTKFGLGSRTIATVDSVTATPSGLTFSSLTPNSGIVQGESDQDVAIGKAATFKLNATAATEGQDYIGVVGVTLSDGNGDGCKFRVQCR